MYKKILVPVDLEHIEKIDKALCVAADLAKSHDIPLVYVAVSPETPSSVAPSPEKFAAELNMFAREQAERFGVRTESRAITSVDPAVELDDKLLTAIAELEADLVVMASHIPGLADQLHLVPSNAAYILRNTKISVFVVR